MSDNTLIAPARLTDIAATLLQAGGFTAEESRLTATSLIRSNLLGHDSHGVMRVAAYVNDLKAGEVRSGVDLLILKESGNTLQADAQGGLGQVQMPRLLKRLLEKAKTNGSVTGTLRNSGHVGRLGEWVEAAAQAGYPAFLVVNNNGLWMQVVPPGGIEGKLSTNPLAFAFPRTGGQVFSFDMSTSAVAAGKIRLAYHSGEQIAPGLMQDAEGHPTTDPSCLFKDPKGALLPMGGAQGYKGFGLAMMVDLLGAGLSGGLMPPAPPGTAGHDNAVLTIWNPEYFAGLEHLEAQAETYFQHLKDTKPVDPAKPVRLPGDRATTEAAQRAEKGIPLSAGTCKLLAKTATLTGLPIPEEFQGVL